MNELFRVGNDTAILNRVLEFSVTLVSQGLKRIFLRPFVVKRRYVLYCQRDKAVSDKWRHGKQTDDRRRHASPCLVRAVI